MENWIAEKLQLATEESYKDPANIQSKHQKHQAFEAELAANADRIQSVLAMGQNLIDKHQCAGSEEAVQVCWLVCKCNIYYCYLKQNRMLLNFRFHVVITMLVLSSTTSLGSFLLFFVCTHSAVFSYFSLFLSYVPVELFCPLFCWFYNCVFCLYFHMYSSTLYSQDQTPLVLISHYLL